MNLAACEALPTTLEAGTWYRAARLRHLPGVLRSDHTKLIPSRFSPGNLSESKFEILYLADSHLVALFEVQALLGVASQPGEVISNPQHAWVVVNAAVKLQRVVDLTDEAIVQSMLNTTAQELTGDWRGYQIRSERTPVQGPKGLSPTQLLGATLYEKRPEVEGFLSLSARVPYHRILAIFPERLAPGSAVRFDYVDANGARQVFQLP